MNYCGFDMGKKSSQFCILDEDRKKIGGGKVRNRISELSKCFGQFPPMRIVIEASTKSFWMADRLEEMGHEVIVVDPGRTKAIGAARIKHDKLDAKVRRTLCRGHIGTSGSAKCPTTLIGVREVSDKMLTTTYCTRRS